MDIFIEKTFPSDAYNYDIGEQGARLYKARNAAGLNIKELANKCGVFPLTITNIELGRQKMSQNTAKKLSTTLNMPIFYLGAYDLLSENTFGDKLKKARLYHGHAQLETANSIGVIKSTIQQWEKNSNMPSENYKSKIEQYLSILPQ